MVNPARALGLVWAWCSLGPLLFLMVGCRASSEYLAETSPEEVPEPPRPLEERIWERLQREQFRSSWQLWPNRRSYCTAAAPHHDLSTTYVNRVAWLAVRQRLGYMPPGALIVEESYSIARVPRGVRVMYKAASDRQHEPASDRQPAAATLPGMPAAGRLAPPDGGDWFWVSYTPDGRVLEAGRVTSCRGCHSRQADNDHVFSGPLD